MTLLSINKWLGTALLATLLPHIMEAQTILSLDSCKAKAIRNNKQLSASKIKQEAARNLRKSARTKYLPRVQALGAYVYSSREISILNDEQKEHFSHLGDGAMQIIGSQNPALAGTVGAILNAEGQGIVDAFHTDTRHMFAGTVMLMQPLFMGGSIMAANKMADISERMAENSSEASKQDILYQTEQAYWNVVSLRHKQRLAESYLELVRKLDNDVQKMIQEGVATRAEGLNVAVKVNEAEMTLTQVNNGLALSRMLLCQLCGLPLEEEFTLSDETDKAIGCEGTTAQTAGLTIDNETRPELRMLQNTVDMSRQSTRLLKAGNLPKVALIGGYSVTNPHVFNGFQREFAGMWNVGVMVSIPLLNWGDVQYKVRAAKNATSIAQLELEDAREKVDLQISQNKFKVNEAEKRLALANTSCKQAEENLRCANLGFKEGVMQSTTVMEAQTAWLKAQSQKIDAEIDIKLSETGLKKALGTLGE